MKILVNMHVLHADCGDGSFSASFYNSLKEMKRCEEYDDERWQALLDDEDPYQNGTLGEVTIEVELHPGRGTGYTASIKPFYVNSDG